MAANRPEAFVLHQAGRLAHLRQIKRLIFGLAGLLRFIVANVKTTLTFSDENSGSKHLLMSRLEDTMSIWSIDAQTVTHSIQLAVAPVFFLTAVAGMIGSVAGRLARIIDRARKLEESLRTLDDHDLVARYLKELHFLRERGRLANVAIGLLTLCGMCIGLTIVLLFVGQAYGVSGHGYAVFSFLLGVVAFVSALCCFLWETVMATRILDFHMLTRAKAAVRDVERDS